MAHGYPRPPTLPNCAWDWKDNSDSVGYLVESFSTGNKIFLPAAGRYEGTTFYDDYSPYWLSTAYNTSPIFVHVLLFNNLIHMPQPGFPYLGMPVRPVSNYSGDVFKKEETQLPAMPSRSNARIE